MPEVDEASDGDLIDGWRVIWTPGHDPGHICLFREEDGVLIAGDLLLPGHTPNIQPAPERADALEDFFGSLERVSRLAVRLVLPAHGRWSAVAA